MILLVPAGAQIRRGPPSRGRHVTSSAVDAALHDVVLSRRDVRAVAYDTIDRWLGAWVERTPAPSSAEEEGREGGHADHDDEGAQHPRREAPADR